jgi:hypothetical protein
MTNFLIHSEEITISDCCDAFSTQLIVQSVRFHPFQM